ncbi:helix-turn-helix domain-containing protein [Actinomadura nitritigenes]|uniref:helix-turn-helix domain-containing protein n=1 Tax=Actinomadura nitritigenes TaxID=134602 RepID=UPI003D8A4673
MIIHTDAATYEVPPTAPPQRPKREGPTLIQSVQRALRLLEAVADEPGAPAKKLARVTGLPLPTAYHLLRTLAHENYLRTERGGWHLGTEIKRLV